MMVRPRVDANAGKYNTHREEITYIHPACESGTGQLKQKSDDWNSCPQPKSAPKDFVPGVLFEQMVQECDLRSAGVQKVDGYAIRQ